MTKGIRTLAMPAQDFQTVSKPNYSNHRGLWGWAWRLLPGFQLEFQFILSPSRDALVSSHHLKNFDFVLLPEASDKHQIPDLTCAAHKHTPRVNPPQHMAKSMWTVTPKQLSCLLSTGMVIFEPNYIYRHIWGWTSNEEKPLNGGLVLIWNSSLFIAPQQE